MRSHIVTLMLAALALSACAGGTPALRSGMHLTVTQGTELPPPMGVDETGDIRPYRIGAFDRLSINVYGVPELTQTVQADAAGRIALPLVGVIEARGKTADEVAEEMEARLRGRYLRDPEVTVNLEETVSQVVTIDGQVREPGLYPVVGRMTLMRAIATAKGTTEFARLNDVVVFRTVQNNEMAALYNLQAIRRGQYPDPEIYANDVVVVGDSPARRLFRDLIQAAGILTTPLVALVQR